MALDGCNRDRVVAAGCSGSSATAAGRDEEPPPHDGPRMFRIELHHLLIMRVHTVHRSTGTRRQPRDQKV
jgi:hypothetical protein